MNDGGPAFPRPSGEAVDTGGHHFWPEAQSGMSLRDYFAAAALTGYIISCDKVWRERYAKDEDSGDDVPTLYARTAYRIADAMITARAKGQ